MCVRVSLNLNGRHAFRCNVAVAFKAPGGPSVRTRDNCGKSAFVLSCVCICVCVCVCACVCVRVCVCVCLCKWQATLWIATQLWIATLWIATQPFKAKDRPSARVRFGLQFGTLKFEKWAFSSTNFY